MALSLREISSLDPDGFAYADSGVAVQRKVSSMCQDHMSDGQMISKMPVRMPARMCGEKTPQEETSKKKIKYYRISASL
jgi:hypothetical protein